MKKYPLLLLLNFIISISSAQQIPYGNNPQAGKYVKAGEAKIYYEVYGQGEPLLLLHGDLYGSIGEFAEYYPMLSKEFKVIAVGKRGHGQSDVGNHPFTEKLLAEDALAVLKNEKHDKATVVGFSGGGITAYYLAAYYPENVVRVVAMAGGLNSKGRNPGVQEGMDKTTGKSLEQNAPEFVNERKKLMPQPERFGEVVEKLKERWKKEVYIEEAKAKAIRCPVLIVIGDRDYYSSVEGALEIHRTIPASFLAVIPNCDHVGLIQRPSVFQSTILPFLTEK
jgi:pimeloyl-ACP methyl ester carboxylesterase